MKTFPLCKRYGLMPVFIILHLLLLMLVLQLTACARTSKNTSTSTGWKEQAGVRAKADLSQTKILQGSDGLVYLQVDLEGTGSPHGSSILPVRNPTDFVVVLDRSGSMAAAKKIDYARQALQSLVNQLGPQDRFALVTFSDWVETPFILQNLTAWNRPSLLSIIRNIHPQGSTNLSGGLQAGIQMLQSSASLGHARRLILISDGIANMGITDSYSLNQIASSATQNGVTISTIGVGLEFNESLLSSLADYGAGRYHFLEHLQTLHQVLAQEFDGASRMVASDLNLKLQLHPEIDLVDASGYPIVREGRSFTVRPGVLSLGERKTLFLTLRFPTYAPFKKSLGDIRLDYRTNGIAYSIPLISSSLQIACLPLHQRDEVQRAIQSDVYRNAWTQSNYGGMLKRSAEKVSKGDASGALLEMKEYEKNLDQAISAAPAAMAQPLQSQKSELGNLKRKVTEASQSPDSAVEMNRLGKQYQYEGIQTQRSENISK